MKGVWIFPFLQCISAVRINPSNLIDGVMEVQNPPTVAERFVATYIGEDIQAHQSVTWNLSFDLSQGKIYQGFAVVYDKTEMVISNFFDKTSEYPWQMTKVGYCAPQNATWDHIIYTYGFGWLADSKFAGNKTVGDAQCDLYTLAKPNTYSWSACLDRDGVPLEYTLLPAPEEVGSTLAPFLSMANLTVQTHTLAPSSEESRLQPSAECAAQLPQEPCNDTSVGQLQMWRQCGMCFDTPADENGADLTSIIGMVCETVAGGGFIGGATNLVRYDLDVSRNYGPFQMFNYVPNKHRVVGSKGLKGLVGRSVNYNMCSMSPSPRCGQCSDNVMGSWLSTPSSGLCVEGKPVGTDGCTWAVQSYASKNFSCIAPHLKDDCAAFVAAETKQNMSALGKALQVVSTTLGTLMGHNSSCPDVPVQPSAP